VPHGFNYFVVINQATTAEQINGQQSAASSPGQSSSMPPCCGSGCAVCVLDYWVEDESPPPEQEMEMEAMLKAIEQAEALARQMIANQDGEPL
jgi:hypothetical protein